MSAIALRLRLDQSRLYDWAMRLPIVVYSFFVLVRDVVAFCDQIVAHPELFDQPDGGVIIATLARVSQWMFVALLAVLPLFRHRPIAKSEEILPRLGALIAVGMPPLFMLLDRAEPNLAFNLIAVVACLSANVMAVLTLSFLGRSLSIMPEARALVTGGPYALVRHPLYLFELLGVIGIVLQVRSLPAAAMMVLVVALQVARALGRGGVDPRLSAIRQLCAAHAVPHSARSARRARPVSARSGGALALGGGDGLGAGAARFRHDRAAEGHRIGPSVAC